MLTKYTEKEILEIFDTRFSETHDSHIAALETAEMTGEKVSRIGKLIETYRQEEELKARKVEKQKVYLNNESTVKTFGVSKVDGIKKLRVYYMDGKLEEYELNNENISFVKESMIHQAKQFCKEANRKNTKVVRDSDKQYVKRWKAYLYIFDNLHYVTDKSLQKEINNRIGIKTLQRINVLSSEKIAYDGIIESEESEYFRSMKLCKTIVDDAKIKSKKTK